MPRIVGAQHYSSMNKLQIIVMPSTKERGVVVDIELGMIEFWPLGF
jgi:hypothetical protein